MDNKKLFVGNIQWQTTKEMLLEAFGQFGTVEEIVLPVETREDGSSRPRGFAFVTFSTPEEAAAAIEGMNNQELDGRRLVVNHARPKQEGGRRQFNNRDNRGGYNGGYSGRSNNRFDAQEQDAA